MEVPENFYKYRSAEGDSAEFLRKTLTDNELYFPAPYSFNDPFDCHPYFSFEGDKATIVNSYKKLYKKYDPGLPRAQRRIQAKEAAKSLLSKNDYAGAQERTRDYYFNRVQRGIGVFCVTTIPDNILMWSHYANNHKGVCLEFCGLNDFFANAQKVIYQETRPVISAFSGASNLENADGALLTKSNIWRYEQEWRVIMYSAGPGIYKFPGHILKRVIIGANASKETVELVTECINSREIKPKISHAKVDPINYRINT